MEDKKKILMELKAHAYDIIANLEALQARLTKVNEDIRNVSAEMQNIQNEPLNDSDTESE
jgi:prefoldin subunit 5